MFLYFPGNYMWSLGVLRCMASGGTMGDIHWACEPIRDAADVPPSGDLEAWHTRWIALSRQVEDTARTALAKGQTVTARDGFYRAALYYQWSDAFLDPSDPRGDATYGKHLECFREFGALWPTALEFIEIPFRDYTLPAFFVAPEGASGPTPVVILSDGLDGTKEEMFPVAAALAARGIACLGIDNPGQAETLRRGVRAEYDSEHSATAAYDYLAGRGDIDPARVGIMGASLGGYYIPRAVAFEKRIRAAVAWAAIYDFHKMWRILLKVEPGKAAGPITAETPTGTTGNHVLKILGVDNWDDAFVELEKYTLEGVAPLIECDLLVVHGEEDKQTEVWDAQKLYDEAGSKHKELKIYRSDEGGQAHVQLDRPGPAVHMIADWFVERLTA